MDHLLVELPGPTPEYSVVFEQDQKVAYAYLRRHGRIVADVWLYNCGEVPEEPEWAAPDARARAPFTNPRGYASEEPAPLVQAESDVACSWTETEAGQVAVDVLVHGRVYARLAEGAKPGWALLARRDGPLARKLDNGS